jgi:hypothetical protein
LILIIKQKEPVKGGKILELKNQTMRFGGLNKQVVFWEEKYISFEEKKMRNAGMISLMIKKNLLHYVLALNKIMNVILGST